MITSREVGFAETANSEVPKTPFCANGSTDDKPTTGINPLRYWTYASVSATAGWEQSANVWGLIMRTDVHREALW